MAGNQVTLTFGGDADQLVREAQRAAQATERAGTAATDAGGDYNRAAGQTQQYSDRMAKLGAAVDGASTAIGDAAATVQALADAQTLDERRAQEHARALNDLEQAQLDVNQAMIDGRQAIRDVAQANIDAEQAALDETVARQDLAEAIAEYGANSVEAKQAQLDLKQAQEDALQAQEDVRQANLDSAQALVDVEAAQLDANEAMMAANPPELQKWADQLNTYAPLLQGLVGIIALVTAAQWAWNVAMTANPIGLVVVGIAALVAAIVWIATQTDWFQRIWAFNWAIIKSAAESTWNFIKQIPGWISTAFKAITNAIVWPFKTAFNQVAMAWNYTVGRLSWTVPNWIPGIGGSNISVPRIPTFHTGGVVQGAPGQEVLAVLQAGETVLPTQNGAAAGGGVAIEVAGEREVAMFVKRLIREYRLLEAYP